MFAASFWSIQLKPVSDSDQTTLHPECALLNYQEKKIIKKQTLVSALSKDVLKFHKSFFNSVCQVAVPASVSGVLWELIQLKSLFWRAGEKKTVAQ